MKKKTKNMDYSYFLERIPFFAVWTMIIVCIISDYFILRQPELLISTLPIIFVSLLYLYLDRKRSRRK